MNLPNLQQWERAIRNAFKGPSNLTCFQIHLLCPKFAFNKPWHFYVLHKNIMIFSFFLYHYNEAPGYVITMVPFKVYTLQRICYMLYILYIT